MLISSKRWAETAGDEGRENAGLKSPIGDGVSDGVVDCGFVVGGYEVTVWRRIAYTCRDGWADSPSRTRAWPAIESGGLAGRRPGHPPNAGCVNWGGRAGKRRPAATSTAWAGGMFSLRLALTFGHAVECSRHRKLNQGFRNKSSGVPSGGGWDILRLSFSLQQGFRKCRAFEGRQLRKLQL